MVRRLLMFVTLLVVFVAPVNASYASASGAKDYIQKLGDDVVRVMSNGNLSSDTQKARLSSIFTANVDAAWIGRFVLGRHAKELSSKQMSDYQQIYRKFLTQNYIVHFEKYNNETFNITGVSDGRRNEYLVRTKINRPNTSPIRVDYRVRLGNQGYVVFDIIAEGISIITTHRAEFSSIIAKEGVDGLIQKISDRVN